MGSRGATLALGAMLSAGASGAASKAGSAKDKITGGGSGGGSSSGGGGGGSTGGGSSSGGGGGGGGGGGWKETGKKVAGNFATGAGVKGATQDAIALGKGGASGASTLSQGATQKASKMAGDAQEKIQDKRMNTEETVEEFYNNPEREVGGNAFDEKPSGAEVDEPMDPTEGYEDIRRSGVEGDTTFEDERVIKPALEGLERSDFKYDYEEPLPDFKLSRNR